MTAAQLAETAEERVARLTVRLDDGFQKIGEAMSKGVAVDNWERHFEMLVREYESLEDELQARPAAEPVQVEMQISVKRQRQEVL